jgi:hypothetical protein
MQKHGKIASNLQRTSSPCYMRMIWEGCLGVQQCHDGHPFVAFKAGQGESKY